MEDGQMNYYAIHVKTGCEISVAKKLDNFNRNLNGRLFNKVVVPFNIKTTIDTSNGQAYQRHDLWFNSYIFIQLDELTTEIYCLINELTNSIFKILQVPIQETEMTFLATGEVTEFIVEIPEDALVRSIQQLLKEIIKTQKEKIHVIVKNNRYLHMKLTTNMAKSIFRERKLTVGDIISQPMVLLKEVLKLYDCKISEINLI